MDAHGRISSSAYRGRPGQAPGMMRHGPLLGPVPAGHHLREPLLPPEPLEKKVITQEAEMERLARENRRLAESNVAMRQELVATQKELQMLQTHLGSIRTESDIQIRGLMEKIGKMEADMYAGDLVKELQQAHMEAQNQITARRELNAEIELVTEELEETCSESKKLPDLHSELDGLRQEHQNLRSTFEYEKGLNIELVERMRGMETNLMSMAREVERLRTEVTAAEQRINAPNQYVGTYPQPAQALASSGYAHSFSKGVTYTDGSSYATNYSYADPGFGYANPAPYSEAYGRGPQAQMTAGASVQATDSYSSMNSATGAMHAYGGPQAR
ncbi:protein FLX-like 4 [Canna indica]|uniref:Protein FLX-like 4 n=1 Tax=Canna indica TaxID=4628 RepID=A0AAQ3KSM8_9LILI|nr:protein FLX-like 4 [Canna indica]